MRSKHYRSRVLGTLAALTLAGGAVGIPAASAAQISPSLIGPKQLFDGQVNGVTSGAVIKVDCPVSFPPPPTPVPESSAVPLTGHPAAGQTVDVVYVAPSPVSNSNTGFTGEVGDHVIVQFESGPTVGRIVTLSNYGVKVAIPTSLTLPCSGTGKVSFVPAPSSDTARAATVPVTYLSQTYVPDGS